MDLNGKVALVTGGGTGLGREISLAFARAGCDVAVNHPGFDQASRAGAEATAEEVRGMGRRALSVAADVSKDAQVREMVAAVEVELGRLDVLVNCAGYTVFVPMADLEAMHEDDWDRIQAVNTKGPFFCARAVAPIMQRQGAGRIVSVTSLSGIRVGGSSLAYAVSKAGHQMLMRCLATVLGPEITVNAIAPGVMDTGWGRRLTPGLMERAIEQAALKKLPDLVDIAETAVFFARNGSISGQTMIVDGGRYMPM